MKKKILPKKSYIVLASIKQAMVDKNLTDSELCKTVGMGVTYFRKMLSGAVNTNKKFIQALEILKVDESVIPKLEREALANKILSKIALTYRLQEQYDKFMNAS